MAPPKAPSRSTLYRNRKLREKYSTINKGQGYVRITNIGQRRQIVNNISHSKKLVKFLVNIVTQVMHLFVEFFIAQRVMDASFDLKETISNAKWYNASMKTQKLIPLMLLRAQKPVVLTAGKVIVMSMNTFATVLKTAASYFTVFLAMQ